MHKNTNSQLFNLYIKQQLFECHSWHNVTAIFIDSVVQTTKQHQYWPTAKYDNNRNIRHKNTRKPPPKYQNAGCQHYNTFVQYPNTVNIRVIPCK